MQEISLHTSLIMPESQIEKDFGTNLDKNFTFAKHIKIIPLGH